MLKYFAIIFSIISLTSCQVAAKTAMMGPGGRVAYNETIQKGTAEQMLLNIVRLRYFDSPMFLDVATVTSQFTYRNAAGTSIQLPGFNTANPVSLRGDTSWQNQPTIQYSPLEGKNFAGQLMQPVDLKTLQQLIYTGWDIDRLFRLVVQMINDIPNAPLAASPANDKLVQFEKFYEITELLRHFQLEMKLRVGIVPGSSNNTQAMQISFPVGTKEGKRLAKFLNEHVEQDDGYYVATFQLGFNKSGEIGILPRSLLGAMYYSSLGVYIPSDDIESGAAFFPKVLNDPDYNWQKSLGSLMNVCWSKREPKCAHVKVQYRNKWFFIDDRDMNSKKTFILLQQLYSLKSMDVVQAPPILTIPLG